MVCEQNQEKSRSGRRVDGEVERWWKRMSRGGGRNGYIGLDQPEQRVMAKGLKERRQCSIRSRRSRARRVNGSISPSLSGWSLAGELDEASLVAVSD